MSRAADLIPFPRNGLVSYHYYKKFDLSLFGKFNLIADSGAYSAKTGGVEIGVRDLVRWYTEWRSQLAWCATLDVIGDQAGTRRNWEAMRDLGVDSVPTIHFPEPPGSLDYYGERGVEFVGLGGQVGRQRDPIMRWSVSVMRYARQRYPQMKFHGWGATSKAALLLPYYSVDSSSWYQGVLWGGAVIFDPRTPNRSFKLVHDGRSIYADTELCHVLSSFYGVEPSQVACSRGSMDSKWPVIATLARSARVWEDHMRTRHGLIAAPRQLPDAAPGPHLHIVMPSRDEPTVIRMANELVQDDNALVR
jgi:hypothetical protein